MSDNILDLVKVVMVRTTHPGNIGAAARAMGNMGISLLALVDPKCDHKGNEAVARASGLGRILDDATVHPDVSHAISDTKHAYAFTARRRDLSQPFADVREAAIKMAANVKARQKVALIFGPEQSGLENSGDRCL